MDWDNDIKPLLCSGDHGNNMGNWTIEFLGHSYPWNLLDQLRNIREQNLGLKQDRRQIQPKFQYSQKIILDPFLFNPSIACQKYIFFKTLIVLYVPLIVRFEIALGTNAIASVNSKTFKSFSVDSCLSH